MCSCRELLLALILSASTLLAAAQGKDNHPGIGRPATPKELAAWDTEVRPDFKGLPKGSGTVLRGQEIWEAKCASCHGIFGESNEVFTPLIGGTTAADIKTGRVARLTDASFPGRSTMMKLPTVSTLWDYIHRAMPWNAPRSLSHDEVYAVTAFMLNLAGVLPENFSLSDANIGQVQALLPNRAGMSTDHALWPGRGSSRPDVQGSRCMNHCAAEPKVASFMPDHARNAHGNLAEQNRLVGPQRGANTSGVAAAASAAKTHPAQALASQHNCMACHGLDNKIVGPGLREVARKYAGRNDALAYLSDKIRSGSAGIWGTIPMPAQTLPAADARAIAQWLVDGAGR
jgi:S-disulfanyl-L-cysteine oxidoreductase SoxD